MCNISGWYFGQLTDREDESKDKRPHGCRGSEINTSEKQKQKKQEQEIIKAAARFIKKNKMGTFDLVINPFS